MPPSISLFLHGSFQFRAILSFSRSFSFFLSLILPIPRTFLLFELGKLLWFFLPPCFWMSSGPAPALLSHSPPVKHTQFALLKVKLLHKAEEWGKAPIMWPCTERPEITFCYRHDSHVPIMTGCLVFLRTSMDCFGDMKIRFGDATKIPFQQWAFSPLPPVHVSVYFPDEQL